MGSPILAGAGRLWLTRFRGGPFRTPEYQTRGVAGAADWGQGDVTKVERPSDVNPNQWVEDVSYQGAQDRPSVPMTFRLTDVRSIVLDLIRTRCALDAEVHFGSCEHVQDYNFGWEKIIVFENAKITTYSTGDLMAMQEDDQTEIAEEIEISAEDMYEILRMTMREVAASYVSEEIVAVGVCDTIACGDCDDPSDGCSKMFAVSNPAGTSPGVLPQAIVTSDRYGNTVERWITSIALGSVVSDASCVGKYLVAISQDDTSGIHYAVFSETLLSSETWTAQNTGFVAGNGPNAMVSYSPLHTWIVGENGYVYFTDDPTAGVEVQDAGVATTEDLTDVDAVSAEIAVAVGENNAVIYTTDGNSWSAVTGPAVGIDLTAVALRDEGNEWWIGDANGDVWVTTDRGTVWTERTGIPGTPTQIDKIVWVNDRVGFMSVRYAGPAGKVVRTISAGRYWYTLPENPTLSHPANDYILDIAVCEDEPNRFLAGGLGDGGADGILLIGEDQ